MLVTVEVALHTGGRENDSTHNITFDVDLPAEARTVLFDTLKQRCCEQLQHNNRLFVNNLVFGTVWETGWEALAGDSVELPEQQQQQQDPLELTLCAMVVPTALAPGQPNPHVSLMELIKGPIPWTYCTSDSLSSTDKHYEIQIEEQPWAPAVLPYLQDRLGALTIDFRADPRLSGYLVSTTSNEDQMNALFNDSVSRVVARVARKLGYDVRAFKNERQDADKGQPDFLFFFRGKCLLSGEGKTPSVVRSTTAIGPYSPKYARKCAGQEAFYINERDHSYGFLTYGHGTFCFVRTGEHKYAITRCIPWHKKDDGVLAHLLYMVLKQIDVWNGIIDEGIWVPNGNGVQQQQQQQQQLLLQQHPLPPGVAAAAGLPATAAEQAAGPSHQQQLGWAQQAHTIGAVAGYTDPSTFAAGHSTQQVQQARSPQSVLASSSNSSSRMLLRPDGGYLQLDREALQLTDIVIGTSQSGCVKLGMLDDVWCAVKAADTDNQKDAVCGMKHEVSMYMHDRLKDLQGEVLPHLVGCGYWKDGHLFVVATSYIDGCQKPGAATQNGRTAAKQALHRLHQARILHGDLSRDNVLLRRLDDGTWQAYLIDLGMSHEAADESDFEAEMRDLEGLFRESDSGSGDMTGFEEEV